MSQSDTSVHDKTVIQQTSDTQLAEPAVDTENITGVRTSLRERSYTEKGMQYEASQQEKKLKSAISKWRGQIVSLSVAISDENSLEQIRSKRIMVETCFTEIQDTFGRLQYLHSKGAEIPELENLSQSIENIEQEHQHGMFKAADRITDLKAEVESKSRYTVAPSRVSRTSRRSHTSFVSKRSDAAAKAAALKIKLKYIDTEAKTKADLEKIQTQKNLEIAEAQLVAFQEETAGSIMGSEIDLSLPLNEIDKKELTNTYVESHAQMLVDKKPLINDPQPSYDPVNSGNLVNSALNPDGQIFSPGVPYKPVGHETPPKPVHETPPKPVHETPPKPVHETLVPAPETGNYTQNDILELAKTFAEHVSLTRLPPPEPNIFDGDPLKYPGWKSSFQTLIEQKRIPSNEKIHYLKKYLSSSVREVIENLFLLASDEAYEEAKKLLEQRYGDPFVIGNAFRDKLEKWPKIQPRDGHGLRKYTDFLKQCNTAMNSINCLGVLDDDRENRKMLQKLPEWIVNRWNRQVTHWKEKEKRFPPFKVFMEFMTTEAEVACNPITSLQALRSDQNHGNTERADAHGERRSGRNSAKGRSFATVVESEDTPVSFATSVAKENAVGCYLCHKKNHELDTCRIFLAKSIEERKALVKEKKLCYGCLGSDHVSKGCKVRKRCEKCHKAHPTSLHGDKLASGPPKSFKQNKDQKAEDQKDVISHSTSQLGVSFMNRAVSSNMSSMILPVYVAHETSPDAQRLVYALLDSQSDTSFILEKTCDSLGVSGTEVDLSLSTMYAENKIVKSKRITGLIVRGYKHSLEIPLPVLYTRQIMPANRSHIPTPEMAKKLPHLAGIASELLPLQNCEVGLLIGYNCARALLPRDVIAPEKTGPFAQKTDLGWGIVGMISSDCDENVELDSVGVSHRTVVCEVKPSVDSDDQAVISDDHNHVRFSFKTKVKEIINPVDVSRMMELDFIEHKRSGPAVSVEDKRFIDIVSNGIEKVDGKYEMPLPLKDSNLNLPNNKAMALHRLKALKRRLEKDQKYRSHYLTFMDAMLKHGHAERVPDSSLENDGKSWYIPHHGVYHPLKPDKIRVVFDCSASFMGESLNSHLLQGPDLTNALIGVLCRFRRERVAFMCDIEQMFFQFKVNPKQRDFLRFLWWENGDLTKEPVDYRMTVHLFGAVSSPGCANYGLKQIASDNENEFGSDTAEFIRRDFYVDDGLTCRPDDDQAESLIKRSKEMCSTGGLRLHKFMSNSKSVLQSIPAEDRAKGLEKVDLLTEPLPVERALGVQWCVESDCFQFRLTVSEKPCTRRGVLSMVSSVYDPLGLISPVVLVGKQILQQLCADQMSWDEPIPDSLMSKWDRWKDGLHALKSLKVDRCFKPEGFGNVVKTELHHFSDASKKGYGQCSYLRLVDDKGKVHCSLVMSKSRVVPLKPITIPRLELNAALVSVKISALIKQELDLTDVTEWYWTDSKIVLGYIANDARRFHVFVANRVQQIHDHSVSSQWRYIETKENPADIASRGVSAEDLVQNKKWFSGPEFLWEKDLPEGSEELPVISSDDQEVKKVQVFETQTVQISEENLWESLKTISSWTRLQRVVALCLKFVRNLKQCVSEKNSVKERKTQRSKQISSIPSLTVEDLTQAQQVLVMSAQCKAFKEEIDLLQTSKVDIKASERLVSSQRKTLRKGQSKIYRLDPFLDSSGVLRVGGRLSFAQMSLSERHPIILPKTGHVTELIVRHFHERVNHQGRGITSNEIRGNGFWVVGLSAVVSSLISRCVTCRRLRGFAQVQKMASLPDDRIESAPPFTYCGVDYFGPWYIHEGRKELKRWGVIFTCLCCRAVHIETAVSMTTDSFVNALRRFIALRGPVRVLRSDRGTNFIGAERELAEAVSEMDDKQIEQFLLQEGCDFSFKTNVPHASHMGGVWERQIRSVRNVLSSLLFHHGKQLDDESLRTFMCEAAAVVNSRPLSVQNTNDPMSLEPLSPNHLLTMKSKLLLPPPGQFQRPDLYCRKRWRRVQYLANEFWLRWRKEYLQNLQKRSKWHGEKRNAQVGDIVLITDDNMPRSQWHLGKIVDATADQDGLVRKVKLLVGTATLDKRGRRLESKSYLERPIHKLVLLYEAEATE